MTTPAKEMTPEELNRLEELAKAVKKGRDDADWEFAKAITPTVILALIAQARASLPNTAASPAVGESLPYESVLNGFTSIMGVEDSGDLLDDARKAIDKLNALLAAKEPAPATHQQWALSDAIKAAQRIQAYPAWPKLPQPVQAEVQVILDVLARVAVPGAQQGDLCRTDGRCQYAIDHGAEGLGHCPTGKCCMPLAATQQAEPVAWRVTHGDFRHYSGAIVSGRDSVFLVKPVISDYYEGCADLTVTPLYAPPVSPSPESAGNAPTDEQDRRALELANAALIASEPKFQDGWPRHEAAINATSCALNKPGAAPTAAVQPSDDLRAALQEFVDYHTKPAGMTLDIATDKAKCREFMENVDTRHSTMVQRALALLAHHAAATPEQSDTTSAKEKA